MIAFHGGSLVCWRFAQLRGFQHAMDADIRSGAPNSPGRRAVTLTIGRSLHHRSCVPIPSAVTYAIERHPSDYYVNLTSAGYPAGAVRGTLHR